MGEEPGQNKQVLRRVVYRAGGPDVSQEAPLQIGTSLLRASPSLKEVGGAGGGDRWMGVTGILTSWFQTTLGINNNSQR